MKNIKAQVLKAMNLTNQQFETICSIRGEAIAKHGTRAIVTGTRDNHGIPQENWDKLTAKQQAACKMITAFKTHERALKLADKHHATLFGTESAEKAAA